MEKLKKIIGRALLLFLIFAASVAGTALMQNSAATDNRQDMNDCFLPELMVEFDGVLANRMYGYVQPMQLDFIRDSVTPLDTTRELTFVVNPYNTVVTSLSYEIRTSDGSKVIENRKIKNLTADDSRNLRTTVRTGSDLLLNQEYSMQITLETSRGPAYYYTRVIARSNLNTAGYVRFVKSFAEKSLDAQNADDLAAYLEPEETESFTNYANIDIHSTLSEVSWGDLNPRMYRRGIPVVRDINETTASISLDYQIAAVNDEGEQELYDVKEFYRMRYTSARIMLLDFSRSASQVFMPGKTSINEEGLVLGIRDRNVSYVANEVAGLTAFVQEGDLWCFSTEDGKATRIFSFRKNEDADFRDGRTEHGIQVVRLFDNGDVDFVVYGYMNRGEREGYCGVCAYHYDNDRNMVEERVFIPSTESYEFLCRDLGKLSYVSTDNYLFVLFAGRLYQIDIEEGSFSVLEEGIDDSAFAVSRTHAHAAWIVGAGEDAGNIRMMDFESRNVRMIQPSEDRQLRVVGFMNEDLIYGIIRNKDILTDTNGHTWEAMRALCFETFEGELLKKYIPGKGEYITDVTLGSMLLEFNISQKKKGTYKVLRTDNIMNNSSDAVKYASVEMTATSRTGDRVRLAFADTPLANEPLVVYAKMKSSEARSVLLQAKSVEAEIYYVYAMGHLDGTYRDPAKAVQRADERLGVVLNRSQQYVWERGNKKEQVMLNPDDIPEIVKSGNMDKAALTAEIGAENTILDLTGCTLDSVLYEVSAGRPVLARTGENTTVLIMGYDPYNTWLLDRKSAEPYAYGMEESEEMFEKAGNVFITYLENVSY